MPHVTSVITGYAARHHPIAGPFVTLREVMSLQASISARSTSLVCHARTVILSCANTLPSQQY